MDFAFSAAAAFHIHERIPAWEQALDQMRVELLVQAREKMENLEESSGLSREKIKQQLGDKLGRLDDIAPDQGAGREALCYDDRYLRGTAEAQRGNGRKSQPQYAAFRKGIPESEPWI